MWSFRYCLCTESMREESHSSLTESTDGYSLWLWPGCNHRPNTPLGPGQVLPSSISLNPLSANGTLYYICCLLCPRNVTLCCASVSINFATNHWENILFAKIAVCQKGTMPWSPIGRVRVQFPVPDIYFGICQPATQGQLSLPSLRGR